MTNLISNQLSLAEIRELFPQKSRSFLEEKNHQDFTRPKTDLLLNTKQAAEHLSLALSTLYGLNHRQGIPVFKIRKRLHNLKSVLNIWIKTARQNNNPDISVEADAYVRQLRSNRRNAA
ncbi:helix-turn-helix domain-containing protein [Mucilaginibacter flavidus]|uniref:helix-turn-helix domain-containing protein n=1 Tax=Mucilaginibacter flavidus TaxID=2949309 RepID=UPI002092F161|nr:helix-turn-helix domain-containing protein [Mucilaginibacter flavidus]MCO5948088.1 helix-turn-helix domain-containing protein [Mucilaginibacter flavidus]